MPTNQLGQSCVIFGTTTLSSQGDAFFGCIVLRPEDGTPHPWLNLDVLQPILHRWDPAEVVFNVLLADRAYRHPLPVAIGDCRPKYCLAQENAFAVMAERPLPRLRKVSEL